MDVKENLKKIIVRKGCASLHQNDCKVCPFRGMVCQSFSKTGDHSKNAYDAAQRMILELTIEEDLTEDMDPGQPPL